MGRRIEIKGKAKTYVAIGVLVILAWSLFGQSLFSFDIGYFNRGLQVSLFRSGHFEIGGVHWDQQDRTLGYIVSSGGETLVANLDAEINRGTLVLHAWRWPAFLFDEPTLHRARYSDSTNDRLEVALPGPGLYTLSISGVYFGGDIAVDWWIED
ncbi:MAG TPA: hypothetical protein VE631_07310 [Alphaproteobacteria bacterium]|nr:hypothetical protein [Alphaproteobacteria bacterium]